MSASTPPASLDVQEQIVRINRAIAETQKLFDEAAKMRAEAPKLAAEAAKFRRDPWFVLVGVVLGALATQVPAVLRGMGMIP